MLGFSTVGSLLYKIFVMKLDETLKWKPHFIYDLFKNVIMKQGSF